MSYIVKPPLGVLPKTMHRTLRIQDICRALYEYSMFYPTEDKIDFMCEWVDELCGLLYEVKDN
jgi:hypothetical protein